jgi:hypothetical protein
LRSCSWEQRIVGARHGARTATGSGLARFTFHPRPDSFLWRLAPVPALTPAATRRGRGAGGGGTPVVIVRGRRSSSTAREATIALLALLLGDRLLLALPHALERLPPPLLLKLGLRRLLLLMMRLRLRLRLRLLLRVLLRRGLRLGHLLTTALTATAAAATARWWVFGRHVGRLGSAAAACGLLGTFGRHVGRLGSAAAACGLLGTFGHLLLDSRTRTIRRPLRRHEFLHSHAHHSR